MCFMGGGMPADNSAEIARQQAAAREKRVNEGRGLIDQAFTQFDDPYFEKQQQSFSDFYTPQITDQYRDANRALTLNLARSGNLNSGAGARQLSDLERKFGDTRTQYADQAMDFANQSRANVEAERSKLYQHNLSAADPSAIGSAVQAGVGALGVQPTFSPVGNLFSEFMNTANTGLAAEKAGYPGFKTGLFKPTNAATVVR